MLNTNISGETMIFAQEKKGYKFYSTSLGSKNQDGTWDNAFLNVQFKKGVEIEDRAKIDIKKGFLSFRNWESGEKKGTNWYIFVLEFETVEQGKDTTPTGFESIDEELPF